MSVERYGRAALASFTMKRCYFDELVISHIETQNLGLQHQKRDGFGKSQTLCRSATTAIIEALGVVWMVNIVAKSVMTNWESLFCSAAGACFGLVHGASAIVYNLVDAPVLPASARYWYAQ